MLNSEKKLKGVTLAEKYLSIGSCFQKNNFILLYTETSSFHMLKILDENGDSIATTGEFKRLVGVNDSYIYCISDRITKKPLYIYSWKLERITTLGQRDSPKRCFYFPSDIKQIDNRDGKYFWLNPVCFNIMNELNGQIVNSIEIKANKFVIYSANNILLMSQQVRRLYFYDFEGSLMQEIELINFPLNDVQFYLDKNEKPCFFCTKSLELLDV